MYVVLKVHKSSLFYMGDDTYPKFTGRLKAAYIYEMNDSDEDKILENMDPSSELFKDYNHLVSLGFKINVEKVNLE